MDKDEIKQLIQRARQMDGGKASQLQIRVSAGQRYESRIDGLFVKAVRGQIPVDTAAEKIYALRD